MTSTDIGNAQTQVEQTKLPGFLLKQAREERGLNCEDVAAALNLSKACVKALENDDYDQLPAPTFIRGYIRSYAKFMQLDAEQLVALYQPEEAQTKVKPLQNIDRNNERRKSRGKFFLASFILLLLVVAGLGVYWWLDKENALSTAIIPASQLEQVTIEGVDGNLHVQSLDELDEQTAQMEIAEVVLKPAAPTTDEEEADEQPQVVEDEPRQAGAKDVLELSFIHDCWVRVTDGAGNEINSGLKRAGDVLTLSGNAPFELHLGYAPGVMIKFNGKDVDFQSSIRGNVARIKLG